MFIVHVVDRGRDRREVRDQCAQQDERLLAQDLDERLTSHDGHDHDVHWRANERALQHRLKPCGLSDCLDVLSNLAGQGYLVRLLPCSGERQGCEQRGHPATGNKDDNGDVLQ
eukprot:4582441-Prymnesium_polylepis.3